MQRLWMHMLGIVCLLLLSSIGSAQMLPHVSPSPLIRLTGILKAVDNPMPSAFPVLVVWVNGQRGQFRVVQAQPVFSAYQADDVLRQVSVLGLRIVGEAHIQDILTAFQRTERPIIIEGWLRRKPDVLTVRSVQPAPSL